MLVLAVDTATTSAHGSVALVDDHALRGATGFRTSQPRHAERLLPSVDYLLAQVEAKLDDVEGFCVAIGPGSFTGLRIGIAAVEGLAYTLERPAVGVSTLDATAFRYRHRRGLLVALIEAYRGQVYGASYRSDGESIEQVSDPVCMPLEDFLASLEAPPDLVAGSATVRYRDVLDSLLPDDVTVVEPSFFIAEEIARLGARKLEAGEHARLGGLDALYLPPAAPAAPAAPAKAPAK